MMTKVLTGVLSVGLLTAGAGGALAANDTVNKQDVDNKYFTHTEVQDGQTLYGYEREGLKIYSEQTLTQEELEQVKVDNMEPEDEFGKTPYSYEHEGLKIYSEQALTQEELEQVKVDNTEPEDESFNGTISK